MRDRNLLSLSRLSLLGRLPGVYWGVYRESSSLLGPVVPLFRALSGLLKFTVRRHKFNADLFSSWAGLHEGRVDSPPPPRSKSVRGLVTCYLSLASLAPALGAASRILVGAVRMPVRARYWFNRGRERGEWSGGERENDAALKMPVHSLPLVSLLGGKDLGFGVEN